MSYNPDKMHIMPSSALDPLERLKQIIEVANVEIDANVPPKRLVLTICLFHTILVSICSIFISFYFNNVYKLEF